MSADQDGVQPINSTGDRAGDRLPELREILLRGDEAYLSETVESVLDSAMARKIEESRDQMAEVLAPVIGQAIRHQIRDAQDDIIDALYPVIGRSIQRAVSEAMQALARRVDEGLRSTFSVQRLALRIRARLQGIPESELLLREALPFQVQEVFLIHRSSGLLLRHVSRVPSEEFDRDLVSSMLTAIRDFAHDTFGTEREGQLDQIQYGETSILVEPGPLAYLAVVTEGVEPADFGHEMRTVLSDIHRSYYAVLRDYDGNPERLSGAEDGLSTLLVAHQEEPEAHAPSCTAWIVSVSAGAILTLCLVLTCAGLWDLVAPAPELTSMPALTSFAPPANSPTPTSTTTPTNTASVTASPAPTSTLTPTWTPTVVPTPTETPTQAPYVAVMLGSVRLRSEPRSGSPLTGETAVRGLPLEVEAIYGDWYKVRWPIGVESASEGWVMARWVGLVSAPPPGIITPSP